MSTPPLISIITVCFNAENTILRTLRSIEAQTYPHIEYLVIDGASRDRTLDLVRAEAPSAIIYSEPDKGIYDAMNKGLQRATGDYVWFMNAGDALPTPTTVSDLIASLYSEDTIPDVMYGDTRIVSLEGEDLGLRRLRPPHALNWKSFRDGMLVCHQSFVVRRELAPLYDMHYELSADVDWCIRVLKQAKSIRGTEQVLSLYLCEGASTTHHRRSLCERFHVMRKHYGLRTTIMRHLRFLFVKNR